MSLNEMRLANILFESEDKYVHLVNEAVLNEAVEDVQGYIETLDMLKNGLVGHTALKKVIEELHDKLSNLVDEKTGRLASLYGGGAKAKKAKIAVENLKAQIWDLYKKLALSSPLKAQFEASKRKLSSKQLAIEVNLGRSSSSPTGSSPTGSAPTGSSPTGSSPTGSSPTGSSPTGSAPTGSAPTGSAPTIGTRTTAAIDSYLNSSGLAPADIDTERRKIIDALNAILTPGTVLPEYRMRLAPFLFEDVAATGADAGDPDDKNEKYGKLFDEILRTINDETVSSQLNNKRSVFINKMMDGSEKDSDSAAAKKDDNDADNDSEQGQSLDSDGEDGARGYDFEAISRSLKKHASILGPQGLVKGSYFTGLILKIREKLQNLRESKSFKVSNFLFESEDDTNTIKQKIIAVINDAFYELHKNNIRFAVPASKDKFIDAVANDNDVITQFKNLKTYNQTSTNDSFQELITKNKQEVAAAAEQRQKETQAKKAAARKKKVAPAETPPAETPETPDTAAPAPAAPAPAAPASDESAPEAPAPEADASDESAAVSELRSRLRKLIIKEMYSLSLQNLFEDDFKHTPIIKIDVDDNEVDPETGYKVSKNTKSHRSISKDDAQLHSKFKKKFSSSIPDDVFESMFFEAAASAAPAAPPPPGSSTTASVSPKKKFVNFKIENFNDLETEPVGSDLLIAYEQSDEEDEEIDLTSLNIPGIDKISIPKDAAVFYIIGSDNSNKPAALPDRFSSESGSKTPDRTLNDLDTGLAKTKSTIAKSQSAINDLVTKKIDVRLLGSLDNDFKALKMLQFTSNYKLLEKMMAAPSTSSGLSGPAAAAAGAAAVAGAAAGLAGGGAGGGGSAGAGGGAGGSAGGGAGRGTARHSLKNALSGIGIDDAKIEVIKDRINPLVGYIFNESVSYDQHRLEVLAGIRKK